MDMATVWSRLCDTFLLSQFALYVLVEYGLRHLSELLGFKARRYRINCTLKIKSLKVCILEFANRICIMILWFVL